MWYTWQASFVALFAVAFILSLAHPVRAEPALLYSLGTEDTDHAFIAMSRSGAAKAKEDLGVDYKEFRMGADEDILQFVARVAQEGHSPIIAIGAQHVLPVLNLADQFPNTQFTVVDGLVPPLFNNVQSVTFKDHEGAFLVGMVAAYTSKSKKIGFVGGVDIPLIRNFGLGFMQGAKFVNPTIDVTFDMVGTGDEAWSQPEIARDIAQKQYDRGIDIIFAAAGGSSIGVLEAAKDRDMLAIGVDTNQNGTYPGHVLTSMIKRVDKVIYTALENAKEEKWKPGIKLMGLKEHAMDYAVDAHNREFMNQSLIEQVETAREKIVSGLIQVDAYSPD